MSRFFSEKYKSLVPYVPGEQPQDRKYVKLNTNESPFPPSPFALRLSREAAGDCQLYSDPECRQLRRAAADFYGVGTDNIIFSNGSDEILYFSFLAFCDAKTPAYFPDITYGFYSVYAEFTGIPYTEIPLKDDFSIDITEYFDKKGTIFIANPNANTGIALSRAQIEEILKRNRDNVVVIDEAYVDFGGESCVCLIDKYPNLLVIQTFSKSRSLAGARLGLAIGSKDLITDLNTVKYSINPYNINRITAAAGVGSYIDRDYFHNNCRAIAETRKSTVTELEKAGFTVLPSAANFILAKTPKISGLELYLKLKEKGVLVRHFETPRLKDYNRITIGSPEQMRILLKKIEEITEEL